jgi:hypothetical protein
MIGTCDAVALILRLKEQGKFCKHLNNKLSRINLYSLGLDLKKMDSKHLNCACCEFGLALGSLLRLSEAHRMIFNVSPNLKRLASQSWKGMGSFPALTSRVHENLKSLRLCGCRPSLCL